LSSTGHRNCRSIITVHINVAPLQQVINNLINNAVDALDHTDNPQIKVNLETKAILPHHIQQPHATENYIHISISDNGPGVERHVLEHIFEPFFTTKEIGKGTGLGLAMAYGTVQSHRGFLTIDSEIGQGSTFHIYLPT